MVALSDRFGCAMVNDVGNGDDEESAGTPVRHRTYEMKVLYENEVKLSVRSMVSAPCYARRKRMT